MQKGEPMSDLISRQAAIDALGEKPLAWTEGEYELGLQNQWQSDVDALKALPAVQPLVIHCTDCEDWLERQSILGVTISELPSAQPEIIYCKDCKWKQGAECVWFADVRPFPSDFCSRAERREE